MAGEYYRWLARNEKPREERELSKEEKRRNWWDYHKVAVMIWTAVLALAIWVAADLVTGIKKVPDYRIAYIGSRPLPSDTVSALESKLEQLGIDLSGDGKVEVQILQYIVGQNTDYSTEMKLATDFASGTSPFFFCEDPQTVQDVYEAFSYADGTYPPAGSVPTEKLWYPWEECAGLANLELGAYRIDPEHSFDVLKEETGDSQALLSRLYVSRRGPWEKLDEEKAVEYTRMYCLFLHGMENAG